MTVKAIETLRFASGEEEVRATLYDQLGDSLYDDFGNVRAKVEKRLAEWGNTDADGEDEDEDEAPRKGIPENKKKKLLDAKTWERDARLVSMGMALRKALGDCVFEDHNDFRRKVDAALEKLKLKIGGVELKLLLRAVSWRVETAAPVIAKVNKHGKAAQDSLRGLFDSTVNGKKCVVEYEPDSDLRDTEQVPLLEEGGVEAFLRREVLPYAPDAWIEDSKNQMGYEVSFARHFYKPQRLRPLGEIAADIVVVEKETEGLLDGLIKRGAA